MIILSFCLFTSSLSGAEGCTSESRNEFKKDLSDGTFALFTSIYKRIHELNREDIWNDTDTFIKLYNGLRSYFDCTHAYIKSQKGLQGIPKEYDNFVVNLNKIMKSVAGFFLINKRSKIIDSSDIEAIEKNIGEAKKIYDFALKEIKKESTQEWSFINKKKEEILPQYKGFFATYNRVKKESRGITPEDIRFIVSMEDLIEPDVPESIVNFLIRIESFKEAAINEKKKLWFGSSSLQRLINDSQEIIDGIRQLYPELEIVTKIARSHNEPAVILLSESGGLFIFLKHLLLEAQSRLK